MPAALVQKVLVIFLAMSLVIFLVEADLIEARLFVVQILVMS